MAEVDTICDANMRRYTEGFWADEDTPFCLLDVLGYRTDDSAMQEKAKGLLERRVIRNLPRKVVMACNLPGCIVEGIEDGEQGHRVEGTCRAASYCMKAAFEAVGKAPTVEEGKALYRELIRSTDGFAGKHSAGNFCPRLDCGLSAGVSEDMVPGTDGECVVEARGSQQQFDFESAEQA